MTAPTQAIIQEHEVLLALRELFMHYPVLEQSGTEILGKALFLLGLCTKNRGRTLEVVVQI